MAIETELKLRIAPEHMARLKRHPFLRSLSSGRATTRKIYSVYLDTTDLQLHHQRMALRLRRIGSQWFQTLKGGGGVQAGLHQRNEWETPVESECLNFALLDEIGATPLPEHLPQNIQPIFVTDFNRSIRLLKFEGALIEMGLDSGEIRAGNSKHPISEVELELKSGEPLRLFRLALNLLDIVPLEIEITSKAEYGYRLHSPFSPILTKVQIPKFKRHTPVKVALQNTIWACLSHLQANVPGAINKTGAEYLHQIRISLRRLRVVLNLAKILCADEELDSLHDHVRKLGNELGRSREWDVFATEILPAIYRDKNNDAYSGQQALARESEKHRQLSHQQVSTTLQSIDFQRLLLRFGAWLNGDYWKEFTYSGNLQDYSEKILRKYTQKAIERGNRINEVETREHLHKLRIACKNLRYCAELFIINPRKNQIKLLVKLQDILGALNDNAVALQLLDELRKNTTTDNISLIKKHILSNHTFHLKAFHIKWEHFIKLTDDSNLTNS